MFFLQHKYSFKFKRSETFANLKQKLINSSDFPYDEYLYI